MSLKQEAEANAFALELLMPREMLLSYLKEYRQISISNKQLIKKLSQTFEVTETTMKCRLLNLGILTSI
jgi:Zn-dependent peptidase ImmA (M78 family)